MKATEKISSIVNEATVKPQNELIKELKKASADTTGHGLPRLIRSESYFLKIMWLTFMLVSVGFCLFMVVKSVNQYLNFEVNTKISMKNEAIMDFPAVSFCNINPMITRAADKYIQHYYETTYNLNFTNFTGFGRDFFFNSSMSFDVEYLQYLTYTPNFDSHVPNLTREDFGYALDQMLFYSEFTGRNYYGEFLEYYDPVYGNCIKYNGNTNFSSLNKIDQPSQGLFASFYIGMSTQYNLYHSMDILQEGLVVIIDDQKRFPIQTDGIIVLPGSQANIILSKTTTKNLPYPYSDCQDAEMVDTLLSREMKRLGYEYTRDNCLLFCKQKQIIDQLGCYDARLPVILNGTPCLTADHFFNITYYLQFDSSECFAHCPFECKSVMYTTSISYGTCPLKLFCSSNEAVKLLNPHFEANFSSCKDLRDKIVSVSIKFKELKYTDIVDSPTMLLGDLIANIGGILGLFVGVSVLSFVEIIELAINILIIYYKKLKLQKIDKLSKNQAFC